MHVLPFALTKTSGQVAQTCRAAVVEMPRPTVRKWCETGYNVAYQKTIKDLSNHFISNELAKSRGIKNAILN